MSSLVRRVGTTLVSSAAAVTLVATGGAAQAVSTSSPAGHGATWLAHQLHHGLIHNAQYDIDDYGLTADTVLGLKAIGGHPKAVRKARRALAHHVDAYTTYQKDRYAGPTAKLLVVAQQTGARPTSFGGVNLVKRLAARVATTPPITGRIEDKSATDYANTIGQVFAARGLLKANHPLAPSVLGFLLQQQCRAGYFRLDFNTDKTAAQQGCTKKSPADTDVTALAVVELAPVAHGHPALTAALTRATRWLAKHQRSNGSFGGGPTTSSPNSNSTGLAAWALRSEHRCSAATDAARWVHRLQVRGNVAGTPLAGEKGAIAYDKAAKKAAASDGITKTTRDQWRRTTTQAAPGLLALSGCRA